MSPATNGMRPGLSRLLSPAVLARIDNLDLIARTVMQGFVGGAHPTAKLGTSTDFAEYRGYTPGDDVRRIDWRVYGRTDRLYIKAYEADSNADFIVALDCSASMNYAGSGSLRKHDYARMATACLLHLGARQRDRLGYAALGDGVRSFISPSARHLHRILTALEEQPAQGPGNLPGALGDLALRLPRRAIVIVLSDLYGEPRELSGALERLRLQGHDMALFHVLDPRELDFELGPIESIEDLESGERMPVKPAQTQSLYAQSIQAHIEAMRSECARRGVDYALLNTSAPLEHLLFQYLSQRARRRRR